MPEAPKDWSEHLGRKVSIRYRLHHSDHPFSEAVGVVAAVAPGPDGHTSLAILDRRGQTISVAASDILAAKLFPL